MDTFLAILAILAAIIGLAGSIIPALPGPPVGWVGLLVLSFTDYYDRPGWFLWLWLGIVAIVTLADNLLPVAMTKKFGGSRAATWGTAIGMVVGMFFGPWGLVLGPFAGAYIGEVVGNRSEGRVALRVATGAFFAFICGVGIKLITSGLLIWYIVADLIR
ncbi:MAG: DUF456 domain-containing protein [Alistipes sp.]|jgi:uncharacterized protein YqgC (DUF456 family)|nr:DUF456 domain-containing protein [Alistipes sp.]